MVTCPNCMGEGEIEGPRWAPPINWSTIINDHNSDAIEGYVYS